MGHRISIIGTRTLQEEGKKEKTKNFLQIRLGLAGTTALPANSNIRDQQQIEALKLLETSNMTPCGE